LYGFVHRTGNKRRTLAITFPIILSQTREPFSSLQTN
jgi:hypothetical protein